MKKLLPSLAAFVVIAGLVATLRAPRNPEAYDIGAFSQLPTLVNGRIKPLDTVARTSLLAMQGRQKVTSADGRSLAPAEWLLDVLHRPAHADAYQTFEIVHPDVVALLNLTTEQGAGGKRFSLQEMLRSLPELDRQARLADGVEHALRSTFQRAIVQLRNSVLLYQHLQTSMVPPGTDDFFAQLDQLERVLPAALQTPLTAGHASPHASPAGKLILEMGTAFATMERFAYLHPIPPAPDAADRSNWQTVGAAWSDTLEDGRINPAARDFATLGRAWRDRQPEAFNTAVAAHQQYIDAEFPGVHTRAIVETRFNSSQPFYSSAVLYVIAFLVGVFAWLRWPEMLGKIAFRIVVIAFAVTTLGILTRMWLEARPPVTNLYSSALFVGWGAVGLCVILEYVYRNAIGSVAAGLIGFATLLIAHHLALGGDTMEMMRAVLDSNFWLATHVVTITVGYSAMFLAGFLAIIYVLRGLLTRSLDARTADTIGRMIYGIVCFGTLFSLVGTVLGGIWADQSWGRFWGWDPKENGALIIVIWCAIILHARWGGYVRTRGLAVLAIFGNVVTAWSWFGVNMLGVGLHSYGFMDAAFWWLVTFAASQLLIIAAASLPMEYWRSFRTVASRPAAASQPAAAQSVAAH
jgi:ABC-type transport system involved in cytochrome c biogenesis permease subunit